MRILAAAFVLLLAPPALAAPAVVDVRIEGATRTLFEGPVRSDGHSIRAASDGEARTCDGTNLGSYPAPGPSATAATVDALTLTGRDFDGRWYAGYEDYFVERLGPDREDGDAFAYWGVLVNGEFTPTGGCQVRAGDGDQVLWAYDAFNGRPFLRLSGATAVAPGEPLKVTVEGAGAGVTVAPVLTDAAGDQTPLTADPAAVTTADDGTAVLEFPAPGWQRIKATAPGYVRSNRLDVCVGSCGPPPADTLVREVAPASTPAPTATASPPPLPTAAPAATAAPVARIVAPWVTAGGVRRGLVEVRWSGLTAWAIESAPAGTRRWTRRATGTDAQAAALRLPAGRTYDLRFTGTDASGRTSTSAIGRAVVPYDDRVLRLRGGWTRVADAAAWRGTRSRGRRGATASVRLGAGRPLVLIRGSGRVELDGRIFRVSGKPISGARRGKAGTVTLRVLAGRLELDGVATAP